MDSVLRRRASNSTKQPSVVRSVLLNCKNRTTSSFTESTAPGAESSREMFKIWFAPSPPILMSPPAPAQTRRAPIYFRNTRTDARFGGPKFATWRQKRACCPYFRKEDPLPPKAGARRRVTFLRNGGKDKPAPAPAPPFKYRQLRSAKSSTNVKKSVISLTCHPPPERARRRAQRRRPNNFLRWIDVGRK